MAVGASKPTVVADADGFFSVKSKMLVSTAAVSLLCMPYFLMLMHLYAEKLYEDLSLILHLLKASSA